MNIKKLSADCTLILDHYGRNHQIVKCLEELIELEDELNRELVGNGNDDFIVSEIADVIIMAFQMALIFGMDRVEKEIERKIERTIDRMKKPQIHEGKPGVFQ